MEMYKLYKKIFNNVVISKIIYSFVKFEHVEGDGSMDYSLYDKISNSFKYFDLTLEILIKNELHSLFDDYFQFYFVQVMSNADYQDKIKYINYVNLDYVPSKHDIIYLLGYKQLGLNRFQVIYNHYKQEFIKHKTIILSSSAMGGNFEIYSFLRNETVSGDDGVNGDAGSNGRTQLLYPFTSDLRISNHLFSHVNLHESNGNLEIFRDLYDGIRKFKNSLRADMYSVLDLLLWTIKNGYTDQCLYVLEQMKTTNSVKKPELNIFLMSCSLSFSNIELAKYLVEECGLLVNNGGIISNGKNIFNLLLEPEFGHQKTNSKQIGLKNIDYQVFKYYWSQLDNETQLSYHEFMLKFLNKSTLLNFNFNSCNHSNEMIIMELSKNGCLDFKQILFNVYKTNGYSPTIDEFKTLIQEDGIILDKVGVGFLNRLAIEITSGSFNLDYLKLVLSTISSKFPSHKLPVECFDSKYEIIKIIYENYGSLVPDEIEFNKYENKYSFFGDTRSAQYFYFTILPNCLDNENKFFNLSNKVLPNSILKNYYEIVVLLISTIKSTKLLIPSTMTSSLAHVNHYDHNCFLIYQFLFNLSKRKNSLPTTMVPLITGLQNYYLPHFNYSSINKYKHFRIFNGGHAIDNVSNVDILFLKQYSKIPSIANSNYYISIDTIRSSKLSILQFKFSQLNCSKCVLYNQFDFIKQLFINYPSRLNIIIQNDFEFILTNLKYIVKLTVDYKNPIILNLILLSPLYDEQLKCRTFISIILSLLSGFYYDAYNLIWLHNIKYPNLLSFDKISNTIDSLPSLNNRKMKNILSNFNLNNRNLNNPNIIAIIHCLFFTNKQSNRDNNDDILNGINKIEF